MKFKRHILMSSALASMAAVLSMGIGVSAVHAQDTAAAADDSTTIVVTGIRKSLQSALKQKRNSDRVEEVITAEDIGKFPDKNVADSLSRATGVNVVTGSANAGGFGENEHISIRGTAPELNLTLMDGHNMATGDWFVLDQAAGGRSFNYTMLPSEVVGTIEVIKSSSADLPEGGIGGTVDVHVRKPLDLPSNTFAASAQAMYATLPGKTEPNVSGMYSWKSDDHKVGFLVGAFYEKRSFRRDGQEVLGYSDIANFAGSGKTVSVPSLIGNAFFQQERVREGGNFMLQFKQDDTFELDVSGLYTYLKADNSNHNFMMWGSHLGAHTPEPGYTTFVSPADGKTYLSSATWTAADAGSDGTLVQDDIFRKAHSNSYDLNIDLTWNPSDRLGVKGQLGYTHGEGVTDDSAAWETYWTGTPPNPDPSTNPDLSPNNVGASFKLGKVTDVTYTGLPTDPTVASYLNNHYSWSWGGKVSSPDKELYAKIDVDYQVGDGFFKDVLFGARMTDHRRDLINTAYGWAGNGANNGKTIIDLGTVFTGDTTPSDYSDGLSGDLRGYSFSNGDAVYKYLDGHNGGRQFGFYGQASFGVKEKTNAYYVMTKIGGDNWRGNVGVRAVHTETTAIQYSTTVADRPIASLFAPPTVDANGVVTDPGGYGIAETKHSYWDILPSLNISYKATPDIVIRASAAKVMTRPGYAQLAGYFSLVDTNFTGTAGGNPNLDPFRATQFNLGAEWYYAPQALVSVGIFDMQIDNYITTDSFHGFYTDLKNPQGHDFLISGPVNGGGGTDKGLEANLQQPFGDTGFGFIANYTYSDGKTDAGKPIDGNSKNTFNLTGYFENDKVSTRLAYNFRSKFQSGTDRGTAMWQDDYGTLDGSFSYNLTSHIALTLDAQNLLHEKLAYFVGTPEVPRAVYDNGQSWYVGARLKY